jgi:predicted RNA binding protein YcfA (HicA-like mRNA interferase family)
MRLQNINSKDVVKILEKNGFVVTRQKGTHVIMKNNGNVVVVPVHHKTMPIGTLKSIEKQSGISFREVE